MKFSDLARILAPLRRRIATLLARGVVMLVDDSGGRQRLQLKIMAGEVVRDVEHFQPFGFFSVPMPPDANGAPEPVIGHIGGSKSHAVVLVVSDRRYRQKDEAPGTAGIVSSGGALVRCLPDGSIEIKAALGVTIDAPSVTFTGDVDIDGSLAVVGDITAASVTAADIETDAGISVGSHVHGENGGSGPTDPPQ